MACDRFLGAFLNLTKHKVCGYELRPFSLRHRLVLDAIGSPFLPGGSVINPNPADLVLAARVCSVSDPFLAVRPTFWDGWKIVRLGMKPSRYMKEQMAWQDYIMDTAQHPRVGGKPNPSKRDRGVDWSLSVVVALMEMGFTEEQAWTMPEGRAMYYFFTKAIRDGAELDITTTSMEDRLPEARAKVMAAVAAAQAKAAEAAGKAG
jgi:hypothetical protein